MVEMKPLAFVLLLLTPVLADICTEDVCKYNFEVHRIRTMVVTNDVSTFEVDWNGTHLVTLENMYRLESRYPGSIGQPVDPEDLIMADGYQRNIIAINGQMPGPVIEVMEGAEVLVEVYNNLLSESLTIHWHGMTQRKSQFMDGAAYISQCPILPQQKFQYKFKAEPAGTHWYYGSLVNQRTDGFFGMLIVHAQIPTIQEFAVTVTDWFKQDALTIDLSSPYRLGRSGAGQLQPYVTGRDYSVDSVEVTSILYQSTLLGGRGRWNDDEYPLREYTVTTNARHRFRMVNAAMEHTYEILIDGHELVLKALDGHDINDIVVDSVMIHPGERVDFEIVADQAPERYWMRARTIREHVGFEGDPDGIVKGTKAIIAYDTATTTGDPTTSAKECSSSNVCRVFGCPFPAYPEGDGRQCIHLKDATSKYSQSYLDSKYGINDAYEDVEEHFLNFAFVIGSSVKGKRLIKPRVPLYQYNSDDYIIECTDELCAYGCKCTHIKDLPYKATVQIVFLSYEPMTTVGAKYLAHHVPHLHGHNFAVIAQGFPPYNASTGQWLGMNPIITCDEETSWRCENPFWTGDLPELNTVNPPVKDTIVIPARGYVVVRFKTDNPGYWLLRNQRELPYQEGMSMIINEAKFHHPFLPWNFPQCYDYEVQNLRRGSHFEH